jgi:uncharacterized protein (DUF169 family)
LEEKMPEIKDYNKYGEDLEKVLKLRFSPIAIKLLANENEIPEGAVRPKRDNKNHIALCQAFAMSRRQGLTVAMTREDHWCWAPIIGFGLEKEPEDKSLIMFASFPSMEYGKYKVILSAPLSKATFKPDIVLVYSNPAQLRGMIIAAFNENKGNINSDFYMIDSCMYSIVPSIQKNEYRVTVPDPGEYERAMTGEDEMIFSIPAKRLEEFMKALIENDSRGFGYRRFFMDMRPDFPRPPFYDNLFKMWGLDK